MDGNWTVWEPWQPCTHSCGGGTSVRKRYCANPTPTEGGYNCTGNTTEVKGVQPKQMFWWVYTLFSVILFISYAMMTFSLTLAYYWVLLTVYFVENYKARKQGWCGLDLNQSGIELAVECQMVYGAIETWRMHFWTFCCFLIFVHQYPKEVMTCQT